MCMKVDCDKCKKPTWKGCGKHIEQALKGVPEDDRCQCTKESSKAEPTPVNEPELTPIKEPETAADNQVQSEETK